MLSQDFIAKVKACGLKTIAEKYTKLTQIAPNVWRGSCPHPDHNDSTPSFDIVRDSNGLESWKCWGCHCDKKDGINNFGNDNIAFMQWMSHSSKSKKQLSFKEAVYLLADYYGIPKEADDPNDKVYKENKEMAIAYHKSMPKEVIDYLFSRGLTQAEIDKWCIGFNPTYQGGGRITFPICDKYKNVLGFSNRKLNNTEGAKYINSASSEIFNKKKILYGIQYYNANNKNIIITEGQFDVILAHKFGLDNVVATLGCHLSEDHISILKAMNKNIVLCYDGDEAGEKGIAKALEDLYNAGIANVNVLILPQGMDLADTAIAYGCALPQYVNHHIMTHSQYRLEKIASQFDRTIMAAQQEFMPQINSVLESIIDKNESILAKNFINKRLKMWIA